MKAIEVSEVSAFAPHVQPGCSEPLLLTDRGRVVATIVPAGEADVESMLLSINPKFGAILERSRIRLGSEGGLSSEQVREGLAIPAKSRRRTSHAQSRPKGGRS
jgi:antitoxin (DNA-binding transcriptional repressor) of toxin-antitoxin stability system